MNRRLALCTLAFLIAPVGSARAQSAFRLSAEEAVALAMDHDLGLKRDRFGPKIAELDVGATTTAWTPSFFTRLFGGSSESPTTSTFEDGHTGLTERQMSSTVGISQRLRWGASYEVRWDGARLASTSVFNRFDPQLQSSIGASFTQPLFRNLFIDEARAAHEISLQARDIADTELAAAVASTRRVVLHAYWSWIYARDFLAVQRESLALAQTLLDGNRTRVSTGAMALVDVIEAEAEVARRGEMILIAEKNVANAEDLLRMHIFEPADSRHADALEPAGSRSDDANGGDAADVLTLALKERGELKALRSGLAIDAVSVRQFRNETRPDASLRVGYAVRGTGGTELLRGDGLPGPVVGRLDRGFGSVLGDLARTRFPSWSVELGVSYPIGYARAEADLARSSVVQQQHEAALAAAERSVTTEVKAVVREVAINRQRLESTATAVRLSERRLDAEQRKFAAGLSTSFFVFQAQRDLAQARAAELASILDHHLSTADLEAVPFVPVVPR